MLQTGSRNKNTTNKAGTIPLIPGDHHTDPTIFTHCIKAVGSRHYVDGWPSQSSPLSFSTAEAWLTDEDIMARIPMDLRARYR